MEICENMQKLRSYLDEKKIKWIDQSEDMESASIDMFICRTWLWLGERKISVVNGYGTYGGIHPMYNNGLKNRGLLEIQIDGLDGVYGDLTADDVIRIIEMIQESGDQRIDALFDGMNEILEKDYEN
jgi:hypothetical protein